jgi:hypothetical protein
MFSKGKSFIFGFLVCLSLTGTTVYAIEPTLAEIYFRKITYMIDGIERKPSDHMGGFIYEGSIYVPLRFVSESLKKDIGWNEETSTVWIGQLENEEYLSNVKPSRIEGVTRPTYGVASIAGTDYSHKNVKVHFPGDSTGSNSSELVLQYNLNGSYTKFKGYIGIDDTTKNSNSLGAVKIMGDQKELQAFTNLKGGEIAHPFEVDVTGITTLQLMFTKNHHDEITIDVAEGILQHK